MNTLLPIQFELLSATQAEHIFAALVPEDKIETIHDKERGGFNRVYLLEQYNPLEGLLKEYKLTSTDGDKHVDLVINMYSVIEYHGQQRKFMFDSQKVILNN